MMQTNSQAVSLTDKQKVQILCHRSLLAEKWIVGTCKYDKSMPDSGFVLVDNDDAINEMNDEQADRYDSHSLQDQ